MENQQQQPIYSLRTLAEQAQVPGVDPREIIAHLMPHLEAMEAVQQQVLELRAHAQSRSNETPLNESLRAMVDAQQSFQKYQAQANEILTALSTRSTRTPPAPLSNPFRGNSEGPTYVEYMSQIMTAYARYPDAFRNDKDKVNYAFASLKGPAAEFFAPIIAGEIPDTDGYLDSFASFCKILETTFGNQLQVDEANHQLQRLRQHGMTMTEYTTKFRTLVARAGWEPKASLGRYKDGLSHEVRQMLLPQWPNLSTLDATIAAAHAAYRNLAIHSRFNKKDHRPIPKNFVPRRFPGPGTNAAAPAGPTPMEIDAMRVKHITSEEKQRRRENNLCLYCGASGHYAGRCPAKNAHIAAVSTEPFSDSENESA